MAVSKNKRLFHTAHYNILAARFRESMAEFVDSPDDGVDRRYSNKVARAAICSAVLRVAMRLEEDNSQFEALKFLHACSPDNDRYPITELWADAQANN